MSPDDYQDMDADLGEGPCPLCGGSGFIEAEEDGDDPDARRVPCPACRGTGKQRRRPQSAWRLPQWLPRARPLPRRPPAGRGGMHSAPRILLPLSVAPTGDFVQPPAGRSHEVLWKPPEEEKPRRAPERLPSAGTMLEEPVLPEVPTEEDDVPPPELLAGEQSWEVSVSLEAGSNVGVTPDLARSPEVAIDSSYDVTWLSPNGIPAPRIEPYRQRDPLDVQINYDVTGFEVEPPDALAMGESSDGVLG